MSNSKIPWVSEVLRLPSPENFTRHLVFRFGNGLILAEGGKQLAEVPKLVASKCLDHAPRREATNGPDSSKGRQVFYPSRLLTSNGQ